MAEALHSGLQLGPSDREGVRLGNEQEGDNPPQRCATLTPQTH